MMPESSQLKEKIKNLPFISYTSSTFGRYFRFGTPKDDIWQFFNPKKRCWGFIKVQKNPFGSHDYSIILRNGWVIRKLESQYRPHYYYHCKDNDIVNLSKKEALKLAYNYSAKTLEIPIIKKGDYLYLDLRSLYLPTEHYQILLELSIQIEDTVVDILCFRSEDFQILSEILGKIRVKIKLQHEHIATEKIESKDTQETMDIRTALSDILTLAYSGFLKKEADIEKFLVLLLNREWDKIKNEKLREKFKVLGKLEEKGDVLAANLLILLEKISSYFDWKFYADVGVSSEIEGVIFGTAPFTFGEEWTQNYYKIVFPALENTLYWPTTIAPTPTGRGRVEALQARLNTVTLKKWRIYSTMGRLKNTGTHEEVIFSKSPLDKLQKAFHTLLGIPSFEKILSERGYLSGFNLDLESWKGAYSLSRYFLAIVQIIEPLEIDSAVPSTRVRDIFGNTFIIEWDLETYFHSANDIHELQKSGWISILLKNEFKNIPVTEEGISIFKTVFGIEPRFRRKDEACELNTIAIVKYFGSLDLGILNKITNEYSIHYDLASSLPKIINEGFLFENEEVVYYVYQTLDKEGITQLVDLMTNASKRPTKELLGQKWYLTWSLIREQYGLIHPLVYAKSLWQNNVLTVPEDEHEKFQTLEVLIKEVVASHQKEISKRRAQRMEFLMQTKRSNITFHSTRVGEKDISVYVSDGSWMLQNFGAATIEAMGKRVAKAHRIVTYLIRRFAYLEPKINRTDSFVKHQNGYNVRTVKFQIETYGI